MPRLHPITGLAACGTGGGRVSFGSSTGEASVLTDGGWTFWLNADEIAYLGPLSGSWAGPASPTLPQAVNIHTGARRPLEPVPEGQARREASYLAAAGNRWQAGQAGDGATFGSCGEFPGGTIARTSTDSRGAAAADGSIVLLDSYQAGGLGFRIGRPDGELYPPRTFPGIGAGAPDAYHLTLIDAGRAIWPAAGAWGTFGLAATPPKWIPGSLRACYVEIAGVAYLVHWLEGRGLVARRADGTLGVVLAAADREFHYDAIAWNGRIRIAWATMDGEPPGSLVIVEWDLVSGLEELAPATPNPRPPDPPIEPPHPRPPDPPVPIVPPITPPHPASPFRSHTKGSVMDIDGKIVQLRGAGGRLIAPDAPNTGTWGSLNQGWRGVRYVGDGDTAARMRARKLSSGRYTFTSEGTNGLAGADGGQDSPALDKQGYFKPDGNTDSGDLEQWRVYEGNENGAIEAQVEQTTDTSHPAGPGKKFFVFPLTVEIVS